MEYQHRIPIHLEEEDKFIFSLTGRQTLVLGIGLALGYAAASDFNFSHLSGVIIGCVLFLLIFSLSVVVAFMRYHHRDLEQWALIALTYIAQPKYYVRYRLTIETHPQKKHAATQEQKEESEEW
jgi:PrgI family protein